MLIELSAATLTFGIYRYLFPNEKTKIKRLVKKLFEEKKLCNSKGFYPSVDSIVITGYGAIVSINIKGICSFSEFQKHDDYIKTLFGALSVDISYKNDFIEVQLILKELQEVKYQKINLLDHQLLLGYDYKGTPITVDMKKTPHLLVTGLSNTGKSYLLKTIIKNLDTKVIMLNAFLEDYQDINNIIHIQGEENILKRLESFLHNQYKRDKPTFIFFEELATIKNKKIIQTLKELLCVARHFNLFLIGLIQISTKEELQCKSYFNARVSFRQMDASSYQVALSVSVSDALKNREFYLMSDDLYKGKTYLL